MTANAQKPTPQESNLALCGAEVHGQHGRNYAVVHLGAAADLRQYAVQHPVAASTVTGKVFLKEPLGLTGMEISFGVLPAGVSVPFLHKHRENEEVYLFLKGKGQMLIDGEVVDVEEGTAVRISPDGARSWRNTSDEDLFYVVIQAKAGSLCAWTRSDGISVSDSVEWPAQA
jgi:mannose-6-phosphate isomerase-like protein (cupin superfamily)